MKRSAYLFAPLFALAASSWVSAAVISYAGYETSSATSGAWGATASAGAKIDFRSTGSDTKAFAISGKNAYGNDGVIFFKPADMSSSSWDALPSYVSGYAKLNGSFYVPGPGFLVLDNPAASIANSVSDVDAGVLLVGSNSVTPTDTLSFTLQDSKSFRLGIVVGTNGDHYKPTQINLTLSSSPSTFAIAPEAPSSDPNATGKPDWYFFDVTGSAGDTFNISVVANPSAYGPRTAITGLTFDSVVPEPASVSLVSVGAVGLLLRRRSVARS